MTQETSATKGVRRQRRGSIEGFRNRLNVRGKLDHDNYAYRIVNDYDDGDRIGRFIENDWEIVQKSDLEVGDKRVGKPSPEGTPVQVSVGQGTKAFLMRKPKEWHDEDQRIKQAAIDNTEATMKPTGTYGEIKVDKSEVKR